MKHLPTAATPHHRALRFTGSKVHLLVSVLALPLCLSSACQAEEMAQYEARLGRWAEAIGKAQTLSAEGDKRWRSGIEAVVAESAVPRQIARSANGPVSVDHSWLRDSLAKAMSAENPGEREDVLRGAGKALSAYRAALRPAQPSDRKHLRRVLVQVLPKASLGHKLRLRVPDWVRRLLVRLVEWLDRLFAHAPQGAAPRWLFWMIVGLATGGLVAALALAAYAVFARFARRAREQRAQVAMSLPQAPSDPEEVLARARRVAAQGAYREAVRYLYLAFLLKLDRAGLLRYDPTTANWEYLPHLPRTDLRASFSSLTLIFDQKWYGGEEAAPSDYHRCEDLLQRALAQAGAA